MSEPATSTTALVWRHPKPQGAAGRCIGAGTDLPVDRRRSKRLARRIQAHARRQRLAHEVWTSPLQRCADVGRWLRSWGWRHHVDPALAELNFGAWDGQQWADIPKSDIDAWVADFLGYAPAGGEALQTLLARASRWRPEPKQHRAAPALIVSHGGWMLARRWHLACPGQSPSADRWPAPPRYGECWAL